MRTTINVDEALLIEAKKLAAETNRTLGGVVESALREMLARRASYAVREPVVLPTYGSGGTLPGVDLDDSAALADVMESSNPDDGGG